jgi:hypothetical protein
MLDENFSYGYDSGLYNLRISKDSIFNCYYKQAKYLPSSFKDECIKVAIKTSDYAKTQNRIPIILLSGGADSEVVVRSFIDSGRSFVAVTNIFEKKLNFHEIEYVLRFQKKHKFDLEFVNIDIEKWLLSEESLMMAEESKCLRPEMLPTMKLMHDIYFKMNGIPVLGNGDFYVSKDLDMTARLKYNQIKYKWNYVEFEYILAWMRYAVQKKIIGSINFFQQTPEIVLSMAMHPRMKNLFSEQPIGKHSSRSTKYLIYNDSWNDVEPRIKFHGGEKISGLCDYLRKTILNKKYHCYNDRWKIEINDFIKRLIGCVN